MKIVGVDNLARETVADQLLVSGVPNTDSDRAKAQEFCDWLNTFTCQEHRGTFFRVYEDDDRLSRGMEDLV